MRVILAAILSSVFILSACGQKGPLYIPQDASANVPGPLEPKNTAPKDATPKAGSPASNESSPSTDKEKDDTAAIQTRAIDHSANAFIG